MKVVVNGYRFGYHFDPIFQHDLEKYIPDIAFEDLESVDPDDERLVCFVEHILTLKKTIEKEIGCNIHDLERDKTYHVGTEELSDDYIYAVNEFDLEVVELPCETTDYVVLRKIILDHGEYAWDYEYIVYCVDGEIFFFYPSNI